MSKMDNPNSTETQLAQYSFGGQADISVVVVARNEEKNIDRCIRSILSQSFTLKTRVEIILVDDGSTDATVDLCRALSPDIKIIDSPCRSISKNRNIGWRTASADYIAYIDADCEAEPGWLANLQAEFVNNSQQDQIAAVGGPNTPPKNVSRFYDALGIMLNTWVGSRGSVQGTVFSETKQVNHLPGLNVMFRKSSLALIDGYDECFARIGEDEDLSIRLTATGAQMIYVPTAKVIHYQRDNFDSWARNMLIYGMGRTWLIRRHPSAFSILFLLPVFALLGMAFYLPVIAIYTAAISVKRRVIHLAPLIFAQYVATHIPYAVGLIYGLFRQGDTPQALERLNQPKLFLMALKNAGNVGDEAIFTACVEQLRLTSRPLNSDTQASAESIDALANLYIMGFGPSGTDIRLLPDNAEAFKQTIKGVFAPSDDSRRTRWQTLASLQPLMMMLLSKPTLVVAGGQWFHDLNKLNHYVVITLFGLVRLLRGRTGVLGVGIGPLHGNFSRRLMRLAFSDNSYIMVRDKKSVELMHAMNIKQAELGTDLALTLTGNRQDDNSTPRLNTNVVGICPCAWTRFDNLYQDQQAQQAQQENTLDQLEFIVRHLITTGKTVKLLPSMNPEDSGFCQQLMRRVSDLVANDASSGDQVTIELIETSHFSPSEFQHEIAQLSCLISMRLHPLIFATNTGIPYIALNYATKVEELCAQFGTLERIVSLESDMWSDTVINRLIADGQSSGQSHKLLNSVETVRQEHVQTLSKNYDRFLNWYLQREDS